MQQTLLDAQVCVEYSRISSIKLSDPVTLMYVNISYIGSCHHHSSSRLFSLTPYLPNTTITERETRKVNYTRCAKDKKNK